MKNVLFHEEVLSSGGTTKAMFQYMMSEFFHYENNSFMIYRKIEDSHNKEHISRMVDLLSKYIPVVQYDDYSEIEKFIVHNKIGYHYNIKSGENYGFLSNKAKNLIHAVFPQNPNQKHGDVYAYVSNWLSKNCGGYPYVPHIIDEPEFDLSLSELTYYRTLYNIPDKDRVFGRIGSYNEFNIGFVQDTILKVLNSNENIWFLLCNTKPFGEHPRLIYVDPIFSEYGKNKFINSCDYMIHARERGETFGISVGEFAICEKPVLTYTDSREKSHIELLGDASVLYKNSEELENLLINFEKDKNIDYKRYTEFSYTEVMKKFNEVFLND